MKRTIWQKLIEWKNAQGRKPLILKGARQVGKTYILQQFGQNDFPEYHYFNFERDEQLKKIFIKDLDPKRILRELSFYLNKTIDIDKDLVIFDEIQNAPRALTSLKYFQEELSSLAICTAGSLLGIQLSDEPFPVGKVDFLNLFPMAFEEFLLGIEDGNSFDVLTQEKETIPEIVHDHLWEQLKIYFIVGGLPEVINTYREHREDLFTALQKVREKQENIIKTYQADMAKHSGKQNAMQIWRLWQSIPAQLAKELDGSAPKFKFKNVVPGVSRYSQLVGSIDWLIAAGLVIKVNIIGNASLPLSSHAVENSFKLYMSDVGLLGSLSNLSPGVILDYDYGFYKGYFAENFVAQEFHYSGTKDLYCWKGRTSEVEFLRETEGDILPVEVKSGWVTQSKSLNVFAEKYKPRYRTILSAKNIYIDRVNKMHRYPLYLASRFPLKVFKLG